MTIGTDSAIIFHGATDAVDDGGTSVVSDGNMSVAADITAWTNDDDAPYAHLILLWQYPSGTIDGNIAVHARPINIDGANDPPAPTTTDPLGYVGMFELATAQAATTDTPYTVVVPLLHLTTKTSQEFEFYLYNTSGVDISADWDLDIIPATFGPHG